MTREDIEVLKDLKDQYSYDDGYERPVSECQKVIIVLDSIINTLEQEPKWVPISERLPERNVEVLVTTEWDCITIGEMYSANDWFIHEGTANAETDEIVAWMPLPEPYKVESEK